MIGEFGEGPCGGWVITHLLSLLWQLHRAGCAHTAAPWRPQPARSPGGPNRPSPLGTHSDWSGRRAARVAEQGVDARGGGGPDGRGFNSSTFSST
jgi:hypothetical protein